MNPIAEEIKSYYGSASSIEEEEEILEQSGIPQMFDYDPHGSGRYRQGSGENPYQHATDFLSRVEKLKAKGWKETPENIKKTFGLTTTQYRNEKSMCHDLARVALVARIKQMRYGDPEHQMSPTAIAKKLGLPNESSVRSYLDEDKLARSLQSLETAQYLKDRVDKLGMVDVGTQTEREIGVKREKMDAALQYLESQGYHIYKNYPKQATNANQVITQKILAKPDVKYSETYNHEKVYPIIDYVSNDNGKTFHKKFTYPTSLDSKRLMIRYAEDGGIKKDGVIELRRGVEDISLGGSKYSQVRILVDGSHYIKGMAIYGDNMPKGVDVIFNTNKDRASHPNKLDVLKPIKNDPDNPFGSAIKDAELGGQRWYKDKDGKMKLSLINKRADEDDWSDWKKALPSQFLSKQSKILAKNQLNLAKAEKNEEFSKIMELNNPTIKKYYLEKFANSCDGAAKDLKAAALPGQKYHVILPMNSLNENQVYAPNYKDGTKLALIRYPHGGIFEIPVLTVNNKNPEGRKYIGQNSSDAIGINHKVASRLSGADFDGDTVMCIPTDDRKGRVRISRKSELPDMVGFDPHVEYGSEVKIDGSGKKHYYRGGREFKPLPKSMVNKEMGVISNLITDMTLLGAGEKELARAVKHSMVVIDAEKHKLDYKASEVENGIAELKRKWQPKRDKDGNVIGYGGAGTIVSRAKGEQRVLKRRGEAHTNIKGKPWYDPKRPEGALIYMTAADKDVYYPSSIYDKTTGIKTIRTTDGKKISYNMYDKKEAAKYDPVMKKDKKTGVVYYESKDGKIRYRTLKRTTTSTRMAETDDARSLMSDPTGNKSNPMEILYADYANSMKALANRARLAIYSTGNLKYNPQATKIYKKEVSELNAKLNDALKNPGKERYANRLAISEVGKKTKDNPDLTPGEIKKLNQQSISKYREEVGTISRKKRAITISDRQWEAIQAGAITERKLKQILTYTDPDSLRERAMPNNRKGLSTAQISRIKALATSGFSNSDIAEQMNISPSAVSNYLKGGK